MIKKSGSGVLDVGSVAVGPILGFTAGLYDALENDPYKSSYILSVSRDPSWESRVGYRLRNIGINLGYPIGCVAGRFTRRSHQLLKKI